MGPHRYKYLQIWFISSTFLLFVPLLRLIINLFSSQKTSQYMLKWWPCWIELWEFLVMLCACVKQRLAGSACHTLQWICWVKEIWSKLPLLSFQSPVSRHAQGHNPTFQLWISRYAQLLKVFHDFSLCILSFCSPHGSFFSFFRLNFEILQQPIRIFEMGVYSSYYWKQNGRYRVKKIVSKTGVKSNPAFCLRPSIEIKNSTLLIF